MQILTSKDATSIIIAETEIYSIRKMSPHSDLHIITHKPTGREFGVTDEDEAKKFAQFECWNTAVAQNIERKAYAINKLSLRDQLKPQHLLEYLRYVRQHLNDAAFRHIYRQLKESFEKQFPKFFKTIEKNRTKELYLP